jgi:hypothetical protein
MERLLLKNANCIEQSGADGQVNKQIAEGLKVRVLEAVLRNGISNRFKLWVPIIISIRGQEALGVDYAGGNQRAALQ